MFHSTYINKLIKISLTFGIFLLFCAYFKTSAFAATESYYADLVGSGEDNENGPGEAPRVVIETGKSGTHQHYHCEQREEAVVVTLHKDGLPDYDYKGHWIRIDERGYNVFPDRKITVTFNDDEDISQYIGGTCTFTINYDYMEDCTAGDWKRTKNPTCTSPGRETKYCTLCGQIMDTRVIAPLGHNYSWVIDSYATCTTNGTRHQHCSRCGNNTNNGDVWQKAVGHDWHWVIDSELSCTTDYSGHKTCTRSQHNTSKDGPVNTNYKVFTHAPGHHYEELVNEVEATCTTDGRSHYQCTNVINGRRCTATDTSFKVPATGHYITSDAITKTPSVYENGERTFYCEHCHQPIVSEEIPKRRFNVYLGDKQVTTVSIGDNLVWNGSHGEDGTDGSKTGYDWLKTLIEDNWYYIKNKY